MSKEGIITPKVLEDVDVLGQKAEEFIREREPELWEWIIGMASKSSRTILGLATGSRNARDPVTEIIVRLCIQGVMAEMIARDIMDGKKDGELFSMIKTGYETNGKKMRQVVSTHQEEEGTPATGEFDKAVDDGTGGGQGEG